MRLAGALVACLLLSLVSCQLDCDLPTNNEIENVIEEVLRSGDNAQQPQITLLNVHHVCRAGSRERDRYRFVSFLVEYMCEGNTQLVPMALQRSNSKVVVTVTVGIGPILYKAAQPTHGQKIPQLLSLPLSEKTVASVSPLN